MRRRMPPVPLHIDIVSGRTSPASCRITWGEIDQTWPVATVRVLARAMTDAAARAEAEAAVVATMRAMGLDDQALAALMTNVRSRYASHGFGLRGTLTLVPGVSVFDGAPFVHANIGPYLPTRMSPEELRTTATDWIHVAEAAEHDALFTYALADAGIPQEQREQVFAAARNLRPGGLRDDLPDRKDTDRG